MTKDAHDDPRPIAILFDVDGCLIAAPGVRRPRRDERLRR